MYDVLVIGAGQAGLATGYYLKQAGLRFLIVEAANSIGDSWRHRYDSLHLFTPRIYDELPGMEMEGERNGLPSKDEIADYLESYANNIDLPIKLKCPAKRLWKEGEIFKIETSEGTIEAHNIIVSTGPFQVPNIPKFSKLISRNVTQLHSSEYLNPSQLREGNTLVVGGGNSGTQIATEIAQDQKETRPVYISVARNISFKPLYILNQSIFWYFETLGFLRASTQGPFGRWLKKQPEQVYGYELKKLAKKGKVKIYPRALNAKRDIIIFEDGTDIEVKNIIWATGFKRNDEWIDIQGAFDSHGQIKHYSGMSPIRGLYYVGLPWQSSRGSALLGWVKYDAQKIVSHINVIK
ncbi:putative oxidoreductase CzcO [Paenibacillus sp. J45TS6]|uniref:NAD(P)-binding domain-containing protein n=1 Tax=Paenibacillus gallinarum TaxID=2762232 RepID=A0ABR8T5M8_9BACL|nr:MULTISPECIES: NAD(P)/FAD-dependent oxidoreductase [Paenibacillus]MBD7971071.1 NAD(P)-binding domain-containing protein [Paenibacillus gallinarum]GIP44061.1 putative oxidoreductase CzcO [Paenibacillus sp. J45TS6]